MTLATGSRTQVIDIVESVYGTTPATPTMVLQRIVSETLELKRANLQSAEIRSDYQIADFRLGEYSVAGDISKELIYGDCDRYLEAVLKGTWTSEASGTPNTLIAGTTKRSFSIEVGHLDIPEFMLFRGMVVDSMELDASVGKIATVKFGFLGRDMATLSGTTAATVTSAAVTNAPMDTFTGVVSEGGSPISIFTGVKLSLKANESLAPIIGSALSQDHFPGRLDLTGSVTAYFTDAVLMNKFINETATSISLVLAGVPNTKTYTFLIPKVKYTAGQLPTTTEKGMILTLPFQATLDSSTGTNLKITRSNP